MTENQLVTKYRPKTFDEVVGQGAAVKALRHALEKKLGRSFLFTGPSGTGKTTLARLVMVALGCRPEDLIEVDAATHTGVDDMREITDLIRYRPLGEGTIKAAIIDEAHMLSRNAWNSLLKSIEEPPEHVAWALCTTEPTKVPETVRTRCIRVDLKPVKVDPLADLLAKVADAEGMDSVSDEVLFLCAEEAGGSPRQAIANLALCGAVSDSKEAAELLRSAAESAQAVDLARLLVKGGGWKEALRLLNAMAETNPESIRHVVRAYVSKVALGANSEGSFGHAVEILDEFSEPFNSGDGLSPVILAVGRLLLR